MERRCSLPAAPAQGPVQSRRRSAPSPLQESLRRLRVVHDAALASPLPRFSPRVPAFFLHILPQNRSLYGCVSLWVCMYHIFVSLKEVLEIRILLYCFFVNVVNCCGDFVCWSVISVHNYASCSMLCKCFIWDLLRLISFALFSYGSLYSFELMFMAFISCCFNSLTSMNYWGEYFFSKWKYDDFTFFLKL